MPLKENTVYEFHKRWPCCNNLYYLSVNEISILRINLDHIYFLEFFNTVTHFCKWWFLDIGSKRLIVVWYYSIMLCPTGGCQKTEKIHQSWNMLKTLFYKQNWLNGSSQKHFDILRFFDIFVKFWHFNVKKCQNVTSQNFFVFELKIKYIRLLFCQKMSKIVKMSK